MASSTFEPGRQRKVAALIVVMILALLLIPCAARAAEGNRATDARTPAAAGPAKPATSPVTTTDRAAARAAASALLVDGVALLHNDQYAMALAKFDAAYALVPSPNIHYNRGLAYAGLGKNAAALAAFEAFLTEADHPPEGKREDAKHHRDELSRRVAHLAITTEPAGLEVLVDGESYGTTPIKRAVYVDPGTHALVARLTPGSPTTQRTITAVAGQYLTVTLTVAVPTPPVAAVAAPAPAAARLVAQPAGPAATGQVASTPRTPGTSPNDDVVRRSPPGWTYVAAAGGVALLGAGLTFGLLARSEGNSLTSDSNMHNGTQFDPSKEINGLRYETLRTICLVSGGAALAAGVVGYLIARPPAAESARSTGTTRGVASVSGQPLLGPSLAGARVMVRF